MLTKEVWKNVSGYENLYMVSNLGRIKNKNNKILQPQANKQGYMRIGLYKNNKLKTRVVHRLVAEAFIPNHDSTLEVNHIDGDKKNNCVENLEWVSSSQNTIHALNNDLFPHKKVMIVETGVVYPSIKECAKAISGDVGNIYSCLKGIRKTHKGFHYKEIEDVK